MTFYEGGNLAANLKEDFILMIKNIIDKTDMISIVYNNFSYGRYTHLF
jgi:hypothetical protein